MKIKRKNSRIVLTIIFLEFLFGIFITGCISKEKDAARIADLERSKNYSKIIDIANGRLKSSTNSEDSLYYMFAKGKALMLTNQFSKSIDVFRNTLALDADSTVPYFYMGLNYYLGEKYLMAKTSFDTAIQTISIGGFISDIDLTKPDIFDYSINSAELFYYRGLSNFFLKNYYNAIRDFDYCTKKNFKNETVYFYYALSFYAMDNNLMACEYMRKAYNFGNPDALKFLKKECGK